MVERSLEVHITEGLQARPAAKFVQEANRFTADLFLEKGGNRVNAKSIMGVMSLAIVTKEKITLIAEGVDEERAVDHLEAFIAQT